MKECVVLIGPPGGGKTTQGRFLETHHGFQLFDAGLVIRAANQQRADLLALQDSGGLLPSDRVNAIVIPELRLRCKGHKMALVGYPRKVEQAEALISWLSEFPFVRPVVFYITASNERLIYRLSTRSEKVGEAGRRPDDTATSIETRIEDHYQYHAGMMRCLQAELLRVYNAPVIEIDSEELDQEEVYRTILNHIPTPCLIM